ncbi:MAG: rhomboid family intramembrane serine protease, partial [Deltaproteobacteria bacterium]|nr:rhomboid family intramembrane serine protease [Deltaproteobacteria bacterium]
MSARDTIELIRVQVTRAPPLFTLALALTLLFTFLPFYATGRVGQATLDWGASYLSLLNGEGWRLVTSVFIHLSLTHLAVNALGLVVVGTEVERQVGGGGLLSLALSSSVLGGLAALWWRDFSLSSGASLMVYGLSGAALSFYVWAGRAGREERRWRALLAALWLAYGLVTGYRTPGVDYVGHTAGLLSGFALGGLLRVTSGGARRATLRVFLARVLLVALAAGAWWAFGALRPLTPGLGGYVAWLAPRDQAWAGRLRARHALSLSEWRDVWAGGLGGELSAARERLAGARRAAGGGGDGALRYARALERYLSLLIAGGEASVAAPPPPLAAPVAHLLAHLRRAEGELAFALSDLYRARLQGGGGLEGLWGAGPEVLALAREAVGGALPLSGELSLALLAERLLAAPRGSL